MSQTTPKRSIQGMPPHIVNGGLSTYLGCDSKVRLLPDTSITGRNPNTRFNVKEKIAATVGIMAIVGILGAGVGKSMGGSAEPVPRLPDATTEAGQKAIEEGLANGEF